MINKYAHPPDRRAGKISNLPRVLSRGLKSQITIRRGGLLFVFCFLLFVGSCRERVVPPDDKPPYIPPIVLTAEDIGVTDAFIRVKFIDTTVSRAFKLTRDGQTILTAHSSQLDTLILDEGLLPKRTYKYKAYRLLKSTPIDSSAPLTITSMDSTSHNFNFEVFYLGEGNSSILRDVCIINDTCVWAVGEINCKDSLGNWMPMYNAARWDGNKWNKLRIPFIMNYGTSVFIDSTIPISSVYAPLSNEVWFCNGAVTRLVNNSWMKMNFLLSEGPGRANKMWGTSSNNMYFVADLGRITHWNGSTWRRLESGTTLPIYDIWGAMNQRTGNLEILCIASNQFIDQGRRLLRLSGSTVVALPDSGLSWALNTIWFVPERKYIIGGDGLYISRILPQMWARDLTMPPYYKTSVRGTSVNDIVVVGAFGLFMHYNGVSWQNYHDLTYMPTGAFGRVDVKRNMVVAVGGVDNRAIVLIGRRQ